MSFLKFLSMLALTSLTTIVLAQTYPVRPVKLITNLPVGSGPDVIIRKYAEILSQNWKQPVLVDNRPGASGAVALEYFKNNKDSHSIYIGDAVSITGMPYLYNREHLLTDIKPLFLLYSNNWVVVASTKYNSTQEVLEDFKKKPYFGSWAVGSVGQICGHELSMAVTKTLGLHVPYKEYSALFLDVISHELKLSCTTLASSLPYVQTNRLQLIAMTGAKRNPQYPDVPTLKELLKQDPAIPEGWIGAFVDENINKDIYKKIESDFAMASTNPEIKKLLETFYVDGNTSLKGQEFTTHIKKSTKEYTDAIQKFKIVVN